MSEAQSLPPMRPMLAEGPSEFVLMECAVEAEYRPQMLRELQRRVAELAKTTTQPPVCSPCGRVMDCQDVRSVSWLARELAVLAAVVPYTLAARRADLLLVVAAANYSEGVSRYHAGSRQ
jgi:hypothetical protein